MQKLKKLLEYQVTRFIITSLVVACILSAFFGWVGCVCGQPFWFLPVLLMKIFLFIMLVIALIALVRALGDWTKEGRPAWK